MTKELTDRVKKEIVETQVDYIKNNYPNELINYDVLSKYLNEGISQYSVGERSINELVDIKLLEKLQLNQRSGTTVRLINCIQGNIQVISRSEIKDKDLIEFYEYSKKYKHIRGHGAETKRLLSSYLTKKGLIK